jgi:hypothetical protein
VSLFDWDELGREELKAMRSPEDLYRMPVCRFLALYVPNDEATAAAVNKDLALLGVPPRPVGEIVAELRHAREQKAKGKSD